MSKSIIFDIETGPLSDEHLDRIAPEFEAPSNYKDEEKIAASIREQKVRWKEKAALSPLTGRVICIGVREAGGATIILDGDGDEARLLVAWRELVESYGHAGLFVGFNIFGFDLPFLVRRAWHYGIAPCVRSGLNLRRLENWTDLREVWQLGDRQAEGSLNAIARFFGIGAKSGSGKDFAALWGSDRAAATAYLQNDLNLTHAIGVRMGVIS
jgi:hypothetical protein